MVTYRNVIVGGKDISFAKEYHSGILFRLNKKISRNEVYQFGDWEVEFKVSDFIVASSENVYASENIHKIGYEVCEKALDTCCAKGVGVYYITEPYSKYIELFYLNDQYSLVIHDKETLTFDISAAMTLMDTDGNIIQREPEQQSVWEEVFRYYRFSKGSNNVYDAYRWMYLVFEILMQTIEPIILKANGKPAESEQVWIRRALATADTKFQWSSKVNWSTTDKISYFISEQYLNIRCRLFHAKNNYILLNEQLEQKIIQQKLLELEALCWNLLYEMYSARKRSGGLTNYGFEMLKDSFLNDTTAFVCSRDIKPEEAKNIIEIDDSVILLEEFSCISDVGDRNLTKVYRADLEPTEEYLINSYGINEQNEIFVYGNFTTMELVVHEVNEVSLELQTHIANQGEAFKYI